MIRAAQAAIAVPSAPLDDDFIAPREIAEALPLPDWLAQTLAPSIMRWLALDRINDIYNAMRPYTQVRDYVDGVLAKLRVRTDVSMADLERIPASGPVVVVANHPFGAVEGMMFASLLASVRPDVKLMANHLLGRIAPLRDLFILVDPFETPGAARRNAMSLRRGLTWLESGGLLAVFPSGEVAHRPAWNHRTEESPWNETIAGLIHRSGAAVVPLFFAGTNSWFFQLAGLLHPRVRTALLPRELINKIGSTIRVKVGERTPAQALGSPRNAQRLMARLRARTLLLAHRPQATEMVDSAADAHRFKPVVAASSPAMLAAEVDALPMRQRLLESGDYLVCEAVAGQTPQVVRELGRLRELSFRAVGEGTGQALDLDVFDEYYHHLFIWDRARQELIGAYRLGFSDQLPRSGSASLYTATLFRYAPKFLTALGPTVELSRSFIRAECQRSYLFLLLLWKGIRALITRDRQYRHLLGAVSISHEYGDAARLMMVEYLRHHRARRELVDLVQPRHPFRPHCSRRAIQDIGALARDVQSLDELAAIVSELNPQRKGLPILLKHYLNVGAQAVEFNVDQAFCNALDVLTVLDVSRISDRFLRRLAQ